MLLPAPDQTLSTLKNVQIVETFDALSHDNVLNSLSFQIAAFSNFASHSEYQAQTINPTPFLVILNPIFLPPPPPPKKNGMLK
jgi:hypothetical protein